MTYNLKQREHMSISERLSQLILKIDEVTPYPSLTMGIFELNSEINSKKNI